MLQLAVVIGLCQQSRQQHQREEEEDWSERRRHHTNYIHRQVIYLLHYDTSSTYKFMIISPSHTYKVYVHQPSTTLPRFLSPSIVWYIGRGLNCPDEEVYYYEGYSYHLDVYRLLISIYHLHQIATLLALASNCRRGDDWHILCPSSTSLKHSMDAPRRLDRPYPLPHSDDVRLNHFYPLYIHNSHHFFILYFYLIL